MTRARLVRVDAVLSTGLDSRWGLLASSYSIFRAEVLAAQAVLVPFRRYVVITEDCARYLRGLLLLFPEDDLASWGYSGVQGVLVQLTASVRAARTIEGSDSSYITASLVALVSADYLDGQVG